MTAAAALVRGLSVCYGPVAALAEVDLEVRPGEVLALLGPSGSGKTTLLHTLAGFLRPTAGEVFLAGALVAGDRAWVAPERRQVGMVFQGGALWPHLDVLDTVAYPLRRQGRPRGQARSEAAILLERLGLATLADRRPAQLSGGEQQRVGLARALARNPALFLFDEPTAHLDTHLRGVVLEEMARRREALGAAAVYATHHAAEALAIADRVVVLRAGRVIQVGSPHEVYQQPVDVDVARLTGPASFLDAPERAGGMLLVRPDWVYFDGDVAGTVEQVRYRGPHTDYLVAVPGGTLLVTSPGQPTHHPGARVGLTVSRTWPFSDPHPGPGAAALPGRETSRDAEDPALTTKG